MRIVLDECVPHDVRPLLVGHDVSTVAYLGWAGVKNGELLRRAARAGFDVFVTFDTGVADQHNPAVLPLPVLIARVKSTKMTDVRPVISQVLIALADVAEPRFYIVP